MLAFGLKRPTGEAESAVFHALREWSQESRLTLSSVKPGKATTQGDLVALTFQVAGTGPMRSVAGFLWRVENARLPVRIEQLQLGSRKDGEDDLSLQLRLSAICLPPAGDVSGAGRERL